MHSTGRRSCLFAILLGEASIFGSVLCIDGKKAVGVLSNGLNEGSISASRRWVHSRLGRRQELLEKWKRDVGDGNRALSLPDDEGIVELFCHSCGRNVPRLKPRECFNFKSLMNSRGTCDIHYHCSKRLQHIDQ